MVKVEPSPAFTAEMCQDCAKSWSRADDDDDDDDDDDECGDNCTATCPLGGDWARMCSPRPVR